MSTTTLHYATALVSTFSGKRCAVPDSLIAPAAKRYRQCLARIGRASTQASRGRSIFRREPGQAVCIPKRRWRSRPNELVLLFATDNWGAVVEPGMRHPRRLPGQRIM